MAILTEVGPPRYMGLLRVVRGYGEIRELRQSVRPARFFEKLLGVGSVHGTRSVATPRPDGRVAVVNPTRAHVQIHREPFTYWVEPLAFLVSRRLPRTGNELSVNHTAYRLIESLADVSPFGCFVIQIGNEMEWFCGNNSLIVRQSRSPGFC